jgi:hypothetical protein
MKVKDLITLLRCVPEDSNVWYSYDTFVCNHPLDGKAAFVLSEDDPESGLRRGVHFSTESKESLEHYWLREGHISKDLFQFMEERLK